MRLRIEGQYQMCHLSYKLLPPVTVRMQRHPADDLHAFLALL